MYVSMLQSLFKNSFVRTRANIRKQSSGGVLYKGCSLKLRKIHRKTPVPESPFLIKLQVRPTTLLKKRYWRRCFPVNFAKF